MTEDVVTILNMTLMKSIEQKLTREMGEEFFPDSLVSGGKIDLQGVQERDDRQEFPCHLQQLLFKKMGKGV